MDWPWQISIKMVTPIWLPAKDTLPTMEKTPVRWSPPFYIGLNTSPAKRRPGNRTW